MGEIAGMMLEGCMCQVCGEYLGDGDGFPVTCEGCQGDRSEPRPPAGKPIACADCSRRFASEAALAQHRAAKHK